MLSHHMVNSSGFDSLNKQNFSHITHHKTPVRVKTLSNACTISCAHVEEKSVTSSQVKVVDMKLQLQKI